MKTKFDSLCVALEKAKIPCRVKLASNEISVECGWNYPNSLFNKIDKLLAKLGINSNDVCICAETSGGTIIETKSISGGPKRY